MTRKRRTTRKPTDLTVTRNHPVVARILDGIEAMTRARFKNLTSQPDKGTETYIAKQGQSLTQADPRNAPDALSAPRQGTRASSRYKCHLSGLPMEVILEIGHYLYPEDLLALSRTCTRFNAMLTSKKVQFVWKIAFENAVDREAFWVGPAPKPQHLNEIQYADFVFGKDCMACRSTTVECQTFWSLGVRLCPSCRQEYLVETKELVRYVQSRDRRFSDYTCGLLVNSIPLADDYYRSPDELTEEGVTTGLRLRDEAMFVLSTLLDSKKVCKAKGEFEGCIAAIASHSYLRVYYAKVTALAFSIDSVKFKNKMDDPRTIRYQPSQRVVHLPP